MASTHERRTAPRIEMRPAIGAALSHFPVSLTDLSVTGARIQHDTPVLFAPGKRFTLDFTCNGERFVLACTVARSRLATNKATGRLTYTSGVRFVEVDEFTIARLMTALQAVAAAYFAVNFEIHSH